ncbi:MAG: hypothetical protein DI565_18225 [Ancylobacter novellus]|uniref:Pyroglutamyl-peptidase I n=1 Tax=Ancylobacter novellus TaxID=921 RepID=A0A2W5K2B8_ANCNO|nr:MAG: hypothetical protein DI565_18225 [Ancylobacter novellus]
MTGSREPTRKARNEEILDVRRRSAPTADAPRLLVTAFGRFDGGPNCSDMLLDRLVRERETIESLWGGPVGFARLVVDTQAADRQLAAALAEARPTHVLLTGQAAGREAVSFERVARNVRDLGAPDERGLAGPLGPVRPGGPATRTATWPDLEGAVAAVADAGVPAALSDDAGTHLCNQTLYLALEAAERASPGFVATFLHLPLAPEQVAAGAPAAARLDACFAMPIDDMARAVAAFLVHTRRSSHDTRDP